MALKLLKMILGIYIILCLVIAGLNYGYASRATPEVAGFIAWFWSFYENWIKTFFIVIGSILTLKIIGSSQRTTMRKRNLMGFIIAALVVHIIGPLVLNISELYFFAMPLPWSTVPLQLMDTSSAFYIKYLPIFSLTGITMALIFFVIISVIIYVGTLLFGRRWQCSTICLFNGFASEVFGPVIPLIGKRKKVKERGLKVFSVLRWLFLVMALFFTGYWILLVVGMPLPGSGIVGQIETYKYLSAELLMAMFFWVAFVGRGYCYYCPLGAVLGLMSKLAGQKIVTNNTHCIQCGQCSATCPMSIDIKAGAKNGQSVSELRCVGCGHCVDICPTQTLSYSTRFLDLKKKKLMKKDALENKG